MFEMTVTIRNRIIAAAMTVLMIFGMTGISTEASFAAVKKPAKVKGLALKRGGLKIKATWKKAKNAKKYQVYMKTGSGAWKLKKTLKKRTLTVSGKYGKTYRFKVRGVNGKKKGKFSAVKKITIPKKAPVKPEDPEKPEDDPTDEDESIVVYITLSKDSEFIIGKNADHTVVARYPVRLSYVDLKKYGLEYYYRYEADSYEDGGNYKRPFVLLKKPTVLMLYIKALEKWYFDREMKPEDVETPALSVSGPPTSFFMDHFWDHDCNLMYFVNDAYPLMREGWGSTADYIVMDDGDKVDLAMYTDWNFTSHGAFVSFDIDNPQLAVGEECTIQMKASGTAAAQDGQSVDPGAFPGEFIRVSADRGKTWKEKVYKTDYNGKFTVSFDKPGVYIISGGPKFAKQGDNLPCMSPPVSVAEVAPAEICEYSLKAVSSDAVKYSWEKIEGAASYEVAYQKTGDTKWTTFTTDDTEAEITGLTPGASYSFKVLASCESNYVPDGEPYRILKGNYSAIAKIKM